MAKAENKNKDFSEKELETKTVNAFNNLTDEGKSKVIEFVKMVFVYEQFSYISSFLN